MKLRRRHFLRLGAAVIATPAISKLAWGQTANWPNRIVRLVVGFPPGGGADAGTRIIANRLSEIWGQQVVVENRPGAGANLANDAVAHSPPDGYTMLFSPSSLPIQHVLFASLTFNPVTDFAPVSLVGKYPNLLVASKDSKLKTLQDYIAAAKADPGKVTYATPGIGSVPYLTAELFKVKAGVNLTHVPYRGVAAGAMTDLITNRIDSMFNTTGSLLQSVRSGQTIALAASTPTRSPLAQEIPTFAEAGVPGFDVTSWYAVFVPAKTPADIVSKMHEGMAKALSDPAVKQKFEILGIEAASSTPDELAGLSKIEFDLWSPIIKANNIKGE